MVPHALKALRVSYPDLKITVATKPLFEPFFDGLDVDIMPVDTHEEHHSFSAMLRLSGKMRKAGIDGVADIHDVWRSKIFRFAMWLRGVKTAHVDKGHIEKWMRLNSGAICAKPLKHTVIRYCDTLRRLGYKFDDPQPATKPSRPNPIGKKEETWIGFAPFSAQIGKTYPKELCPEVVQLLSQRYGKVFIHSGGGDEIAFAKQMEDKYPNVMAIFGKLNLKQEIDLISHLDCVVTMDSLVMHLASLMATPVVSVWGATHPSLGYMGYGCDPKGVLQVDMECRPCSVYGKRACKHNDYRCIHRITPNMIAERVAEMLDK